MMKMTSKQFNDHELPPDLASAWRADAMRGSERPEEFWRGQQVRIHSRIESRNVRKSQSLWLAAATAAIIFFAVLFIAPAGPPPARPPQARIDADQELLLAIERSLAAGTPEALEPLTLLVESSSTNNGVETISHKEHGHEN
jgi:hypothetical protein